MSSNFTRSLTIDKDPKHLKDVRILEGDVETYGIFREEKGKVAVIAKFDRLGGRHVLADLEWVGDKRDKIRFEGGEWQKLTDAWEHYDIGKDRERYISKFTGADGQTYVWHLRGSLKVLTKGDKNGPVVAKHTEKGFVGNLDLTDEAAAIGDILFITFLASEGYRGRTRRSWFSALAWGGFGGGAY